MNNFDEAKIRELLDQALKILAHKDKYLIEFNLNERTVTHKLAEYLQQLLPNWDVDCEYNKDGPDTKMLYIPNKDEDLEDSPVYPDIIIHKRGDWRTMENRPHLLVIEARKTGWGSRKIARDEAKIAAYLDELSYRFGALIEYSLEGGSTHYTLELKERHNSVE
jgi:hypothetical protein